MNVVVTTGAERKRLLLFCASLGMGGAERVLSSLANHWSESGHDVTLCTLTDAARDAYPLEPGVRRVSADGRGARFPAGLLRNLTRVREVRALISAIRPHAVISFIHQNNVLALIALAGTGTPVIVSERGVPTAEPLGRRWRLLRRALYPRARAIVVQTQAVAEWARERFDPGLVHVIPNFVQPPRVSQPSRSSRKVVAMGRLHPHKGFDLLIRAFALLPPSCSAWHLAIYGEGRERARLQSLISELGLEGRVELHGKTFEPSAVFAEAEIFALSSRMEGFPNVLLEAMACGTCVIAFDCPHGPSEIIRPGVDGLLVPAQDVPALAAALRRAMTNAELRAELGARAREVVQRFSLEVIAGKWEALWAPAPER